MALDNFAALVQTNAEPLFLGRCKWLEQFSADKVIRHAAALIRNPNEGCATIITYFSKYRLFVV
jgi:hypothetical protein